MREWDDRLTIAGQAPGRVEQPPHGEALAELLATARAAGEGIVPVGGATLLQVGAPPRRYDVAVSTAAIAGIVEYEPADLTVVVRAGTTFAELDAELARHGQFLPLDPPLSERTTVGGAVATNPGGMWRGAYGAARDMVIGMRAALPSGEIARSGGKVVKNVAGYDLAKLFIGSFGTLGVITELAFKVYPRPRGLQVLAVACRDLGAGLTLTAALRGLGSGVVVLCLLNEPAARRLDLAGVTLLAGLAGTTEAVDDLASEVRRSAADCPIAVRADDDAWALLGRLRDLTADADAKVGVRHTALRSLPFGVASEIVLFPAVGLAYIRDERWLPPDVAALRAAVRAEGGHLSVWAGGARFLPSVSAWGDAGPEVALMRTVRDAFDLERVMAPGRMGFP